MHPNFCDTAIAEIFANAMFTSRFLQDTVPRKFLSNVQEFLSLSLTAESFCKANFYFKKLRPCISNLLYSGTSPAAATAESNHTHLSIDLKQYQHHSHTHYLIDVILAML